MKKQKMHKPKRDLKGVIESVRQVRRIEHVAKEDAIWIWGSPQDRTLRSRFKVLIWNIWKQNGGLAFEQEFLDRAQQSDLILIQEAVLSNKAFSLFAQGRHQAVHASTYRRADGARDGVLTLCRANVLSEPQRIISSTLEPILKTTKASLICEYAVQGSLQNILVVNTHCNLIRSPAKATFEVKRVLEFLVEHEGPILFAGDFNTISAVYFKEIEQALRLLNIVYVKPERETRTKLARLDQVFCRGLVPLACTIDTSARHSDHFPIICEFGLSNHP